MILINPLDDTKKSILNVSSKILEAIMKRNTNKFESVVYWVEKELNVSYERVILSLNFLYMIGAIEYDAPNDILGLVNATK